MEVSNDIKRKFDIINALSKVDKPTLSYLHHETNIPESTLKRQLAALRICFGMRIMFVREPDGNRGAVGYYILADWGVIDRDEFFKFYIKSMV
ncbi:helix-turn-helix domain-containing protein [Marinomonas algarum]|uniref:Helix-turn-helix domain-containing protein n=1 Tax=Marinomonas algarum TaxID=2883105 RepID=A0A9X1LF76_9GAMM|nr:helix-turn-helix domain-containing protein [Marinomonas algarum]MCB5162628.1 helix-turn-helix domain-containing protein [Marinomonas algarum]